FHSDLLSEKQFVQGDAEIANRLKNLNLFCKLSILVVMWTGLIVFVVKVKLRKVNYLTWRLPIVISSIYQQIP
ncbi:hypothetical protein, partial [Archaeoglobus sp.]|uniref:hypothetical protein n=1 Tax=Archaeoglobus sp. TaxID=1872626 RepID=UPI0025B987CE